MDPQSQLVEDSMKNSFSTSHLCSLVLDFWASVIQEKTWALLQPPGPLGSARNRSPPSSVDNNEDNHKRAHEKTDENELVLEERPMSTTNLGSATSERDLTWEMARFLLNEERDRLCLWRTNFSDDELDQLIKAPSKTPLHAFGVAIVETLIRAGHALLSQTGRL